MIYRGERSQDGVVVTVDGNPLNPRLDLANCADGFGWGYGGASAAQLALAILADYARSNLISDELVHRIHQGFKAEVIARLPYERWEMDGEEVRRWVEGRVGGVGRN